MMKKGTDGIHRYSCETPEGHALQFFYNPENALVIVDLIHKNKKGGNELLRKTLEASVLRVLLKHCK
jgi:hypothetical protein